MFGWGRPKAADQGGRGSFCWDSQPWGTLSQAQPAPPAPTAPEVPANAPHKPGAGGPPQPPSRSGAAALAAQSAHQVGGGAATAAAADPFDFQEALQPHGGSRAPNTASTQQASVPAGAPSGAAADPAWRGRGASFLLGAQSRALATHSKLPQDQRKLPPQAPSKPAVPQRRPATAAGPATGAWPGPVAAAARQAAPAAPLPPTATTLSLERYLEYWQLLGKGSSRVQPLSELERSVLKAADLKQILLVNGLNAGSRQKKEVTDRMVGLRLFTPLCLLPDGGSGTGGGAAGAQAQLQRVQLDAHSMASLGWVELPAMASAPATLLDSGGGSCCPLPGALVHVADGGHAELAAGAAPIAAGARHGVPLQTRTAGPTAAVPQALPAALPADSQATVASAGVAAFGQRAVQSSPEVAQQQPQQQLQQQQQQQPWQAEPAACLPGAVTAAPAQQLCSPAEQVHGEVDEGQAADVEEEPPEWLVLGVAGVAERSQGSLDLVAGQQLLGRRVAFVLLEDFEQGDPRGIVDTLEAGVQEGQVVEAVGVDHDEDCPPGCTQRHAFHYVRVYASRSTAPVARRAGRRLDLVVDLQPELRQPQLESLLGLGDDELQDAWVLLEPRQEPEEQEVAAASRPSGAAATTARGAMPPPQQQPAGAMATGDSSGWRSAKRGAAPAAAPPVGKRQAR